MKPCGNGYDFARLICFESVKMKKTSDVEEIRLI